MHVIFEQGKTSFDACFSISKDELRAERACLRAVNFSSCRPRYFLPTLPGLQGGSRGLPPFKSPVFRVCSLSTTTCLSNRELTLHCVRILLEQAPCIRHGDVFAVYFLVIYEVVSRDVHVKIEILRTAQLFRMLFDVRISAYLHR